MRILRKAGKFARKRERKGLWRGVVTGIAAVVVFCTTYALILPAITMETEGFSCGMAEHSHTEECYQRICGQQEYFSHSHADTCYEGGQLVCGLTERVCHHHTDACYSQPQPVCGVEELPAHSHGEACYETHSILTCGVEEHPAHSHGEECYVEGELTCTLAETPGHTHGEECFQQEQTLTCGKEETPGHSHTQDCYPADFEPELICGQEDIPEHRHSEACYSRICEKEEHAHSELCVDSHEAFLENQNEILNDVTEPSKADEDTPDDDGTDTSDTPDGMDDEEAGLTILWNDPQAAEEAGYALVCTVDEAEHVHDEECYVPAGAMSQILQGMQYAMAPLTEGGVMPLAEGDTGVLPVGDISAVNTKYDSKTDSFATSVTITFTFPGVEGQKAVSAGTTYTYTYPEGVIIPDKLLDTEQTLLDKSGHPAGTYMFIKNADGTYSVQAVFSQEYVEKNVGIGTNYPVEGYINYGYNFSGSQLKDGKLQFDDDGYLLPISGKITYPDDSTESYNIDVSKEGSWVQDGDKLVYTVYVRTTKGTPDPIAFSDKMTIPEGLTIGEPTVSIQKGKATAYQNWDNSWGYTDQNDWVTVDGVSPNYSAGVLEMSLPSLTAQPDPANSSNIISDVYKVTYTYPISDQTQPSVSPNNSVNVSATDDKGQTVKDSAEKTVTVSKDFSYTVDKSGAIASDKPGYIKWTVTVNSNKQNLVGAKLTDDMLGVADDAEGVTIEPSTGAQVNGDGNSKITDITFTEYENGVNKNQYTITYYTPVAETWDGTTVENKATLDPDPSKTDDEKVATATVTVNGVQFDKTGSHNAETNKLDWVITVNSGKLDIAGATLTDAMFAALNDNAFTIQPETGYSFTRDSEYKITGITFDAGTDGKNTQSYTITYSTDIPKDEESGSTVTSVTNTATLSPGEGKTGTPIPATSTVTLEEAKLSKKGDYDWGKDGINWTVTVNENHKNIATAEFTDSMLGQLTSGDIAIKNENGQAADSGQYTINTDTNGKVTGIVFKAIGETDVNTNQYIITYFTSAPQEWKNKTVHNEAKLTLDGKDIIVPADVTVPGSGDIAKSAGGGTVSEDGSTITIPWTVTLTVPKGGLPINTLVIDDVTKKDEWTTNTNQWITTEQANALIAAGMTWTDDNGITKGTVSLSAGQVAWTGDVDHYTGFTITFQDSLTPPEGATKLTFTYNTTADLTQTTIGQNVFYNFVSVGEKTKGAEYFYYKPGIQKTDGNWQTETSNVSSSGSVTWKVKANVGMGNTQLTLIDTLPEGVTLEGLHLSGSSNLNVTLTVAEDGRISGTDTTDLYSVGGNYNAATGVITLDITPQTVGSTIQDGAEFILTVNCQVTDAANVEGSKKLTNTATMRLDNVEIGSASQTQNWTYQEDAQDVVSKNGKWDNNARLLTYTLAINPEGKDLDPELDYLELKDVLKYKKRLGINISVEPWWVNVDVNISLNPGSVTLKNTETGKTVTDWSWLYSTAAENEWSQYILNTLTVTIPDSTPLQLEYSYSVSSNAKEGYTFELDVSNTATLQTQYYDEDRLESGKTWSNQTTSGGVTSSSSLLTLTKVNAANNGEYLPGAEFTVYAYRQSTGDGGTTASWEYEWAYTTDDKGAITISQGDASKGEHVFDTDVLFKVVETKAPSGYLLPDSPPEYYFYFSGSGSSSMALPDGVTSTSATDLNTIGNSILVKNNKIPTTSLQVNKQWFNSTGTDITAGKSGSVQFDLFWLPKATQPGSGGGSGASGISYLTIGNGTVSTQNISYDSTIQVGSKVRITISMTYRISWGDPTVSITGVSLTSGGWNHDANLSVGTFEGTVTDKSIIVQLDYPVNEFSVEVTNLSDPVSSSSGSTPPTGGTKYNEQPYLITADSGWTTTINNLPVSYTDGEGNTVYYAYYVQETTTGYSVSYENNGGIGSGTIVIRNSQSDTPTYQLPATGGLGTTPYTMGGLLMIAAAGIPLLYSQIKRKKGERR